MQYQKDILHLTLKKKWFDMIKSGVKTEEYREIKDYWVRRLCCFRGGKDHTEIDDFVSDLNDHFNRYSSVRECFKEHGAFAVKYNKVRFKNGYSKDAPVIDVEFKNFTVSHGCPAWGAEPGKLYFTIGLGNVYNIKR